MPTTRAKSVRRAAAKRTILSALDENQPTTDSTLPTKATTLNTETSTYYPNTTSTNNGNISRPFQVPKDFDCTNPGSIDVLLQDIEKETKRLQDNVAINCCEAIKRQHEAYFLRGMKIEKSIKKMKIGDFNAKYMKSEEMGIVALMKSLMNDSDAVIGPSVVGKKRIRDGLSGLERMDLETPMRPLRTAGHFRTPATILRTARKGEMLMSANGSPIENCEEGALVATVTKKRREITGVGGAAMFDINVGGKVISLSDANSMSELSNEMKSTVSAQLNVLQDQISRLMTQIEN